MVHSRHAYALWALLLGITEVGFLYLFASHIPTSVWDFILFPGVAVGSILFGHSVGMFYTGIAINVLFYSALTLGAIVLCSRNAS